MSALRCREIWDFNMKRVKLEDGYEDAGDGESGRKGEIDSETGTRRDSGVTGVPLVGAPTSLEGHCED